MPHPLPATLSMLPSLLSPLRLSLGCFRSSSGKRCDYVGFLAWHADSNNRCPQLYIGEACWAFLFGVIIGESATSAPWSSVTLEFVVPGRAWRCPGLVSQAFQACPCRSDTRLATSALTRCIHMILFLKRPSVLTNSLRSLWNKHLRPSFLGKWQ